MTGDFRELRKQLSFDAVLKHYNVELKLNGDQHHGFCPLPGHKGKRRSQSFSANVAKGIWQCFGCGGKGNVLDFAVLMEGANLEDGEAVRTVATMLMERFLGGETSPRNGRSERPTRDDDAESENVVINAPLDFELKGLDPEHPYLRDRGFLPQTIARFGLGYCSRGLLSDRIAIPLRNHQGQLVGYAGRLVDDAAISEANPKYRFPGRRRRRQVIHEFRKSLLLYNADRIPEPVEDLVVVEGFAGVWWLTQSGIANVVATMGAACSEQQAATIVERVLPDGRVWIFTDGDAAGARCAGEIMVRVSSKRFVRSVKTDTKQPTDFGSSELSQLLPFGQQEERRAV